MDEDIISIILNVSNKMQLIRNQNKLLNLHFISALCDKRCHHSRVYDSFELPKYSIQNKKMNLCVKVLKMFSPSMLRVVSPNSQSSIIWNPSMEPPIFCYSYKKKAIRIICVLRYLNHWKTHFIKLSIMTHVMQFLNT